MKIDQISDGFCTKMNDTGVEDAASNRFASWAYPKLALNHLTG
jgi:hypothetical protein